VPCRVVACAENNGFAGAVNIGVANASGDVLVLLNSDVMPATHGWLSALREVYATLPRPGVLAPRLIYPDGSLQHEGMSFAESPTFPGLWLNTHPGKGLPPRPQPEGTLIEVPAVTAACMVISRTLFDAAGGFDEGYIIGDFEDSDLCLRIREMGYSSYVAPWVELYHLERQSQRFESDGSWRMGLTMYNAWRHSQRWADVISQLAEGNGLA
jgi:GT2 family glycosyltransferase